MASLSRRKFIFGLASLVGLSAVNPSNILGETLEVYPDQILRIFDTIVHTDIPSKEDANIPIEKARRLMYQFSRFGFDKKSRLIEGLYFPSGKDSNVSPINTSWVEYITGKQVLILDPQRRIISSYADSDKYKHISSPKSIELLLEHRDTKIYGEGILRVLDKVSSNLTYKSDFLPRKLIQDYWQTPRETEILKTGDCEDLTFYTMRELCREFIPSKWAYGKMNPSDFNTHIWIELSSRDLMSNYVFDPVTSNISTRKSLGPKSYIKLELPDELKEEAENFKKRLNEEELKAIFS